MDAKVIPGAVIAPPPGASSLITANQNWGRSTLSTSHTKPLLVFTPWQFTLEPFTRALRPSWNMNTCWPASVLRASGSL